jgi:hypothetical protein
MSYLVKGTRQDLGTGSVEIELALVLEIDVDDGEFEVIWVACETALRSSRLQGPFGGF